MAPSPLTASIIPSEGHAKYVCLDPWVNTLITMASLGAVIAYLMVSCMHHTLCRGLEYATACLVYVFISRNERYSPIKLCSTTGLLYNFVTNKKLPIEALTLHQGCPWDTLHINWRDVNLTNGETSIRLPFNVQEPLKEKSRLCNLMRGLDCTAHLMILQRHTWYTVSTTLFTTQLCSSFSPQGQSLHLLICKSAIVNGFDDQWEGQSSG